jgi:hypothetical protein
MTVAQKWGSPEGVNPPGLKPPAFAGHGSDSSRSHPEEMAIIPHADYIASLPLTTTELARKLGIVRQSILDYVYAGRLVPIHRNSAGYLFSPDAVVRPPKPLAQRKKPGRKPGPKKPRSRKLLDGVARRQRALRARRAAAKAALKAQQQS